GLIFGSNDPGILMCLDLKTGKIKWQNRSVGKGSMTYADGALYLRSENGPIALVAATGEGYIELGQFDQPDRSTQQAWTHPVVAEGKLFIRDQDLLMCYDLKAR
ncbi:MAG: polyvinylalcohol dehydrogenase, partial [Planctomycetes bacterium]|nr:polyvinylalcohol dehydrogenase [Planctomycetota bacterium]